MYNVCMKEPMYPRDGAVNFKLPTTKPGGIKHVCSLPGFAEIYTPEETFKTQSPESIDPGRTNPDAMWVNVKTHDVGSASKFVARTLIMASEMLHGYRIENSKRDALLVQMHAIKESLLQSSRASEVYLSDLAAEEAAMKASGFKLAPGSRALERFPAILELDAKVTALLIPARRSITEICQIPNHFWPLSKQHSSLEHFLRDEIKTVLGEKHNFITCLQSFADGTRYIVNLRNGQEHGPTTKGPRLSVRNFEMTPTNQIRRPVWYLGDEEPQDIEAHMREMPTFLLEFAEAMFVGCMDATIT